MCRGGLGDRPVLSQSGCSAWAMVRFAKQSGGSCGAAVSAIEIGCGKPGSTQSSGDVGRRTLVLEKQWRNLWGGRADVAGLAGEVRGGKKRTMLLNCPDPISSELV